MLFYLTRSTGFCWNISTPIFPSIILEMKVSPAYVTNVGSFMLCWPISTASCFKFEKGESKT